MNPFKIVGWVGLAIAIVGAFVEIPYAGLLLVLLGLVGGVAIAAEDHVRLLVSALVLTSLSGAAMYTARPDEQLKGVLPAPPIAMRTFPQNDELALFAEVYDNSGGAPHKVDIVTTITSDTGTVAFKNEEARDSSELQGKSGGYGYAARVPLSDIPPGLYVLKVEATSRLGQGRTAAREVLMTVTEPKR